MDNLSLEALQPRDDCWQRRVVVVVAGAPDHKARGVLEGLAIRLNRERPDLLLRRPRGQRQAMLEENMFVDAELGRAVLDVLHNGAAGRDGLRLIPWIPREAKGKEIRVGADSGIAKEIPGAADGVARFQHGVRVSGQLALDSIGSIDAGDASADDDDVERVVCRGAVHRRDVVGGLCEGEVAVRLAGLIRRSPVSCLVSCLASWTAGKES